MKPMILPESGGTPMGSPFQRAAADALHYKGQLDEARAEIERGYRCINAIERVLTDAGVALGFPLADAVFNVVVERDAAIAAGRELAARVEQVHGDPFAIAESLNAFYEKVGCR